MSESGLEKRLTDFASCAGCAGKLSQQGTAQVVLGLPKFTDPDLIVGTEGFSDAGVYRLRDDLLIVQSLDFFPPLVDDPFVFGQIAAANSISDIYAMGGHPKTCMNIVAFPDKELDLDVLREILRGGADRVAAAGAVLVGGHTLRDNEIKFGMSVTGVVTPDKLLKNSQARPGDVLVLTKALGTGFATTAFKQRKCPVDVLAAATASMTQLNRAACEATATVGAHASTDITGFGLGGHANEMAQASGVTIVLELSRLPLLHGALELVQDGFRNRAVGTNKAYLEPHLSVTGSVDPHRLELVFDPQTSGGLLISISPDKADELIRLARANGAAAACVIGRVEPRGEKSLVVTP